MLALTCVINNASIRDYLSAVTFSRERRHATKTAVRSEVCFRRELLISLSPSFDVID